MLTDITEKRVRYAETDKMGYLYYGRYATLYEIGRSELIRKVGVTYQESEDVHGIIMPVMAMECRYRLPAKYDDLLQIHTYLIEMPTKLIHFTHEIYNEQNELLNKGSVKLFFVEQKTNKRVSCPDFLAEKFAPHF